MKLFQVSVLFLIVLCSGLMYEVLNHEATANRWTKRANQLDVFEARLQLVADAQEYSETCLDTTRMLAIENGILCERDARAIQYIALLDESNVKLKASLDEAVTRMQELIDENNDLFNANNRLLFKVQCLEKALNFVPTPADPATEHSLIFEDITATLKVVDSIITIFTIL
jgi:hypothetical protein